MEILKANTVKTNTYMEHVTDRSWDSLIISDVNDIYDEPPKNRLQKWLDSECISIKQNDFDTCRNTYNDGHYDICNGYNKAYNTYLYQFENC